MLLMWQEIHTCQLEKLESSVNPNNAWLSLMTTLFTEKLKMLFGRLESLDSHAITGFTLFIEKTVANVNIHNEIIFPPTTFIRSGSNTASKRRPGNPFGRTTQVWMDQRRADEMSSEHLGCDAVLAFELGRGRSRWVTFKYLKNVPETPNMNLSRYLPGPDSHHDHNRRDDNYRSLDECNQHEWNH